MIPVAEFVFVRDRIDHGIEAVNIGASADRRRLGLFFRSVTLF